MTELKPCPFCGSTNISNLIKHRGDSKDSKRWSQRCLDCGASIGYFSTLEEAHEAWNRRSEE